MFRGSGSSATEKRLFAKGVETVELLDFSQSTSLLEIACAVSNQERSTDQNEAAVDLIFGSLPNKD